MSPKNCNVQLWQDVNETDAVYKCLIKMWVEPVELYMNPIITELNGIFTLHICECTFQNHHVDLQLCCKHYFSSKVTINKVYENNEKHL